MLYHLSMSNISRSQGKSAVGSFLYQIRGKGKTEDGINRNYTGKRYGKCTGKFFVTSEESNEYMTKNKLFNEKFWREVEKTENRVNSRFCKDFNIALQSEFTQAENVECLQKWIEKNFCSKNLVASVCIHDEHEGNKNKHAHVMVAIRGLNKDGWAKNKDRAVDKTDYLVQVRQSWQDICNEMFEKKGLSARIDCRTLKEQGIDREPQKHNGAKLTAMLRKADTKIDEKEFQARTARAKAQIPASPQLRDIKKRIDGIDRELNARLEDLLINLDPEVDKLLKKLGAKNQQTRTKNKNKDWDWDR